MSTRGQHHLWYRGPDESLGDQVRVTVIATGFNDANIQPTLPTMPVARPQSQASKSSSAPTLQRRLPPSRPAAPAASGDNKKFDIPDFLKRCTHL